MLSFSLFVSCMGLDPIRDVKTSSDVCKNHVLD